MIYILRPNGDRLCNDGCFRIDAKTGRREACVLSFTTPETALARREQIGWLDAMVIDLPEGARLLAGRQFQVVLPSFYNVGDTHTVSMLATQFSIDIPEPDDGESNKKLVNRCIHVGECWQEAAAKHKRMKPSADKDRRSRWMGSLYFTLLQIHSEMLHRGLISIESYYECHKPKEAPK